MADITFTRQQLYDHVWTTPVHKLSDELGLSDRGLGKLCARYNIPVPPRGYWAKKMARKSVSRPKLPDWEGSYQPKIRFKRPSESSSENSPGTDVHPLIAFERRPENMISVPGAAELTHPFVLKTKNRSSTHMA
jgi:hypothetical protein